MENFIILNIQKQDEDFSPSEIITLRRGDNQSNRRQFIIFDGTKPMDLSDKTVLFMAYTNQGKLIADPVEGNQFGEVNYAFPSFITTKAGRLRNSYFQIQKETFVASTNTIDINVLSNVDTNDVQEHEWAPIINDIIAQRDRIVEDSNAALTQISSLAQSMNEAESIRVDSETQRLATEDLRISAEEIRTSNENARISSEQARANAESTRQSSENARQQAETSRANAEQLRVNVEQERERQQQKNNADQAANNAAAQGITYQVLQSGEYALDSTGTHNVPTITGAIGKIYFTPNPKAATNNAYEQWLWVNSSWELAGEGMYIDPVTTGDVDSILQGDSLTAERYLNLTGLSYLMPAVIKKIVDMILPVGSYVIAESMGGTAISSSANVNMGAMGNWKATGNLDLPLWKRVS